MAKNCSINTEVSLKMQFFDVFKNQLLTTPFETEKARKTTRPVSSRHPIVRSHGEGKRQQWRE
jgi:hypothetical protein